MSLKNKIFFFLPTGTQNLLKYGAILILWLGVSRLGSAQEIKAEVHVDRSQINNASFDNLNDFSGKLQAYLNEYSWTSDQFQPFERISMAFQIILLNVDNNHTFNANIAIRSLRPIYHTNRKTTVF